MAKHKRRRRVMRSLKINEISAVDRPAQVGARAVIMKRDDDDGSTQTAMEKRVWLTTDVDGHAHLVDDQPYDGPERDGGDTSWSVSDSDDENRGHTHPWIKNTDDSITIGASEGHTHEVLETTIKRADPSKAKNQEDDDMATENEAKDAEALKAATDRTAELETQLAEANARAEMDDVQKAHLDALDPALDDDARKAFLAAKPAERAAIVAKIAKAKEDSKDVVYKADDGTEYVRADDPRLAAQAKKNDELAKQLGAAQETAETADLRKRAETELANMPGTVETRVAMLKAVDAIGDEDTRKAALESLRAQNEAMAKAFSTVGLRHRTEPVADSPEGKLDALVKRHAEDNKVTEAAAYDAVLKTEEGGHLYGEMTGDNAYIN